MFSRSTRITPLSGLRAILPALGSKIVFFRGNQSSFLRCAKISFVDAFSGIRNATDWNSISCYVTKSNNTILLCMLSTNESRLILSCCCRCFLWFKFSDDKHWYSFMPPAFLFQRGWGSLGASTDETYFHADRLFNSQINGRGKGIMRTSGEIDFRFRLKLKITLVESIYPSQRPECPSLSPHFLLVFFHGCTWLTYHTRTAVQRYETPPQSFFFCCNPTLFAY